MLVVSDASWACWYGLGRWIGRLRMAAADDAADGRAQMREQATVAVAGWSRPASVPLVLHVIPTTSARGGQREARALADQLDRPEVRLHRVLSLFEGPPEVAADFSLAFEGRRTAGVGFAAGLVGRLRSVLTQLNPAVVIAHGSEPLKYLAPAMIGRRKPLIYYAIGTYSGTERRSQLGLWRRLMARADLIAAEGAEVAKECTDRFGVPSEKVRLAPNGRDPEVFHPPSAPRQPDEPTLLFVGALTAGKRPDRFIDLVRNLHSRSLPLRAVLIGDGPLRETLAATAGVSGVEMLGSRADVADQMRQADIFIFCSRPAGEGMPGVLIEAGLSGLPVVATDVPGVSSLVEDGQTGTIVPVEDLAALVDATGRLLGDPELRSRMGRAARQRCAEQFTLTAVSETWLSFIQPLL
jgi:glycosyltransferase involved in cell wall biosynthesis